MCVRALTRRDCIHHGPSSLFSFGLCVHCVKEFGVTQAPKPPIKLSRTIRKAILSIELKGPPEKYEAQRGMRRWRKTLERARQEQGRGRA